MESPFAAEKHKQTKQNEGEKEKKIVKTKERLMAAQNNNNTHKEIIIKYKTNKERNLKKGQIK